MSSHVCDDQNRFFKQNHDVFLSLKKCCCFIFVFFTKPNQSVSIALLQQEISICERNKKSENKET